MKEEVELGTFGVEFRWMGRSDLKKRSPGMECQSKQGHGGMHKEEKGTKLYGNWGG